MHEGKEIVALDLDSVLCDTESMVLKLLRNKFGLCLTVDDFIGYELEKNPHVTEEMSKSIVKAVSTGELFEDAPVMDYAEHAINKLHNNGFIVYIITKRPSYLEHMTKEWLKQKSLKCDKLYLVHSINQKGAIIEACGIKAFVEDRFDTLMLVLNRCGHLEYGLYCIDYQWNNKFYHEQIVKVEHVADAVDRIINFRRWKGYFLDRCVGDVDKFVKEYRDGKSNV